MKFEAIEDAIRRGAEHFETRVLKDKYQLHLEKLAAERAIEIDKALEELELAPFPRTITLESGGTLGGSAVVSEPPETQTLHQGDSE